MNEIDRLAKSAGRWMLALTVVGVPLVWVLPKTGPPHLVGFVLGALLGWALFNMRARRAKSLLRAVEGETSEGVGRRSGLGGMGRLGLMAVFLFSWEPAQLPHAQRLK